MHRLRSLARIAIEGSLILPGCPDDTGESIGERDGGLVVTALALAVKRPAAQPIERVSGALGAMSCEQCRSSTVHEQCSQIGVALLGDFAQATLLCAGPLVRSEAQPGGEMPAGGESLNIADNGAGSAVLVKAPMPGIWRSCWTRTSARVRALS